MLKFEKVGSGSGRAGTVTLIYVESFKKGDYFRLSFNALLMTRFSLEKGGLKRRFFL